MKYLKDFRYFGLVAAAVVLMAPVAVEAAEEPLTPSMTCAAARNLVKTRGAIVLRTGPYLYDRYVDNEGFCPLMLRTEAAWVPTLDNPQCFIGYTCEQSSAPRRR